MTGPAALPDDIAILAGALAEARRQAEDGAPIALAGLEERVAALCAAAAALPPGEARALPGPLGELVAALDTLAATLRTQQDRWAEALAGRDDPHTARQRAAAAYRRGPGASDSATLPDEPT